MKIRLFALVLLSALAIISCDDNDKLTDDLERLNNELNDIKMINSILAFKTSILEARQSENLITGVNGKSDDGYMIAFEDGVILDVQPGVIDSVNPDSLTWNLSFEFVDDSKINALFIGKSPIITASDVRLNPHNSTPLSAIVSIKVPVNSKMRIRVIGQDGDASDITNTFEKYGTEHGVEVYGLYPSYENIVELTCLSKNGNPRCTSKVNITTMPLPAGFPDFEIVKDYSNAEEKNTVFLMDYRPSNFPFMVDKFGKIRWYSTGFSKVTKFGLQRLNNGNIGFSQSGVGQGSAFEYTMMGKVVREYVFYPEFQDGHHDLYEMPNGNFLIPVDKTGANTIEDYIIEMDRNSGEITKVWDLNLSIPKRDTFIKDAVDWLHVNAVIYDESDNSLIISGQRQGVFKVSWDNQLKWILAAPEGWEGYEQYLLRNSNTDFEWVWGQHAPQIMPNGNLFLFDNGWGRHYSNSTKYSRAVEFAIDEDHVGGEVNLVWQYGESRGLDMYSAIVSDVDYLPETNTRLITSGALSFNLVYNNNASMIGSWSSQVEKARIIEVSNDQQVVFEMLLKGEDFINLVYRSEKIKLY